MNSDDIKLLRRYAFERSEEAFADLVQRHIGLVYSAALRQAQGDAQMAQDVTQVVFTGLAGKATRLTRHTSLAGWLYTATRYTAATLRRAEQRRCSRELEAHAMNELLQSAGTGAAWEQLRPVLDEVMHDLKAADREAVLLRFFECLPLAKVGARLGVTENTARMRVERALERLRTALVKRGVTSTAGALAAILGVQAVGAAPAGLAATVSSAAVAGAGTASALSVLAAKALASANLKLVAGAAAGVAIATLLVWHWEGASRRAPAVSRPVGPPTAVSAPPEAAASDVPAGPVAGSNENTLRLTILAADANKPVPGVEVECRERSGRTSGKFISTRKGICDVHYPSGASAITLVSRTDGFADTGLHWDRAKGDTIPADYTLHLLRAVHIGGYVRDEEGLPVAEAQLDFRQGSHEEMTLGQAAPSGHEDHQFYDMQAVTDAEGRWRCDRIAPELLYVTHANISHPEHPSETVQFDSLEAHKLLREGAFVFKLGRAVTLRGSVHDEQGNAVANADVGVYQLTYQRASTLPDGSFVVKACRPSGAYVTITAKEFALKQMTLNLETEPAPMNIVLERGSTLRLRVVNRAGQPLPRARIEVFAASTGAAAAEPLGEMSRAPGPRWAKVVGHTADGRERSIIFRKIPVASNFFTDAEGAAAAQVAVAGPLEAMVQAPGYVWAKVAGLTADDQEHSIALNKIPAVSGIVTDAGSGQPLPAFHVACSERVTSGPKATNQLFEPTLNPADRHKFNAGRYRVEGNHGLERPIYPDYGAAAEEVEFGFMLKFEADGYAPFVSRVIHTGEPDVQLDVALTPAQPIQVTVFNPNGAPAADADVALVRGGQRTPDIGQGRLQSVLGQDLLRTDSRGVFSLPPDDSIKRVIAMNSHGFADVSASALSGVPTFSLQPFGRLEGRWLAGNQPFKGRRLGLTLILADGSRATVDGPARVTTDAEGRFAVPQLPPGKYSLHSFVEEPNGREYYLKHMADAEVRPGETATVSIGTP